MPKEAKNKNDKKHFFKDFKAELKKVIWPTPKQLVNNTVAVLTIVLITVVTVFLLDLVFEKMNTSGINKIKSAVEARNEALNETTDNSETDKNITAEDEVTSEETKANNTTEQNQEAEAAE